MGMATLQVAWGSALVVLERTVFVPAAGAGAAATSPDAGSSEAENAGRAERLHYGPLDAALVALCAVTKLLLAAVAARRAGRAARPDAQRELAFDSVGDALASAVALAAAVTSSWKASMWWVDPFGALVISGYVVATWMRVGEAAAHAAPSRAVTPAHPDFVDAVRRLGDSMDLPRVADVRAYHARGTRNVVEVEVVMSGRTALAAALDAAQALRKRIEALPGVEFAHVHVNCDDAADRFT